VASLRSGHNLVIKDRQAKRQDISPVVKPVQQKTQDSGTLKIKRLLVTDTFNVVTAFLKTSIMLDYYPKITHVQFVRKSFLLESLAQTPR
jgi:hypothetical protein